MALFLPIFNQEQPPRANTVWNRYQEHQYRKPMLKEVEHKHLLIYELPWHTVNTGLNKDGFGDRGHEDGRWVLTGCPNNFS